MSEPEVHDVSTHPCAQCGGPRSVEFREWLDPASAYVVVCRGCGNLTGGANLEEAVSAWDEHNPMREVSDEEAQEVQRMILSTQLTPQVLTALQDAYAVFQASGQPQDVATFVAWCGDLTGAKV